MVTPVANSENGPLAWRFAVSTQSVTVTLSRHHPADYRNVTFAG
jgi:hypothetical protein